MDPGKRKLEISDDELEDRLDTRGAATLAASSSSSASATRHNQTVVIDPIEYGDDSDSSILPLAPAKRRSIICNDRDGEGLQGLDGEGVEGNRLRPSLLPPSGMTRGDRIIHHSSSSNHYIDVVEVISAASAGSDFEDNLMDDVIAMRDSARNMVHIVPTQEDEEGAVSEAEIVGNVGGGSVRASSARAWLAAPSQSRRAVRIGDDYQAELDG